MVNDSSFVKAHNTILKPGIYFKLSDNDSYLIFMYFLCSRAGDGPHIEPQYRQYPQLTKKQQFESELISGAMWFWILWHCWHDSDAVLVSKHVVYALQPHLICNAGECMK